LLAAAATPYTGSLSTHDGQGILVFWDASYAC
jgi:hypothetical protein